MKSHIYFFEQNLSQLDSKTKKIYDLIGADYNIASINQGFSIAISASQCLDIHDLKRAEGILNAKHVKEPTDYLILIAPRLGTISPWSSKATNIMLNANIPLIRAERVKSYDVVFSDSQKPINQEMLEGFFYDRMTESPIHSLHEVAQLFEQPEPETYKSIDLINLGAQEIERANKELGLALNEQEIAYLVDQYKALNKNPSDAELMMFAQANSEHCRHKVFNAEYIINNEKKEKSLFQMIKNTYQKNPKNVLSAYSDNAAVIKGGRSNRLLVDPETKQFIEHTKKIHSVLKVETHNHPTAISPFPGAATGSGGEIRDEGATGIGAKPKAGMVGYVTSHLCLDKEREEWERKSPAPPKRIASPKDIMIEAPIGAASFNNEFGRPCITGFFRTYEDNDETHWGYLKPIMIAGGIGNIYDEHVIKKQGKAGDKIYVLGGPGMLIGMGGGAASSLASGSSDEDLDYASVQRGNAEMQRRAQEVIDCCTSMEDKNPIICIHDVGAGGLSNAVPEIVDHCGLGAKISLRSIPIDEKGMSPMQIWCNESQERYVILISKDHVDLFESLCKRERCPFADIGELTKEKNLILYDELFDNCPIDIPMSLLLGNTPRMQRNTNIIQETLSAKDDAHPEFKQAIHSVLKFPAVCSKNFLVTIGDRTVGGLIARDQLVGPWQVPVADAGVSMRGFFTDEGEAISTGEKVSLANINPRASARMALSESILNIISADVKSTRDIVLSANWMASVSKDGEDLKLFEMVHEIGENLAPKLGISIPVGKDSLSMNMSWNDSEQAYSVHSPVSLIITAMANISDVNKTLTPDVKHRGKSQIIFIDLAQGKRRMGGSCVNQIFGKKDSLCPDLEDEKKLEEFTSALAALRERQLISSYHDRSDGGLVVTLLEMAFAGRSGLKINVPDEDCYQFLFNEELGACIEVKEDVLKECIKILNQFDLQHMVIAETLQDPNISINFDNTELHAFSMQELFALWIEPSYKIQKLRDNPVVADQELERNLDFKDDGLSTNVSQFRPNPSKEKVKPKIALIREQGVNSQHEMAAAYHSAGFECWDVHMNDLLEEKIKLERFNGLVLCGGFSYGDVLGAGGGWSASILNNPILYDGFAEFFADPNKFALGVCNGCQAMSELRSIIPGSDNWPRFLQNQSEQFEGRLIMTKIKKSNSILFNGMDGQVLPIVVSHGEGRACYQDDQNINITMTYVDDNYNDTYQYPYNPNGSMSSIAGLSNLDGRINIMMPHPERSFLKAQLSWSPDSWDRYTPWLKIFENCRDWLLG